MCKSGAASKGTNAIPNLIKTQMTFLTLLHGRKCSLQIHRQMAAQFQLRDVANIKDVTYTQSASQMVAH